MDPVLAAAAAGTLTCLVIDIVSLAFRRHQYRLANLVEGKSFKSGWLFLALVWNAALCYAFAYTYVNIFSRSINPFLIGGSLWVITTTPLLLGARYMEDVRKKVLTVRIYAWLLKVAAVCGLLLLIAG